MSLFKHTAPVARLITFVGLLWMLVFQDGWAQSEDNLEYKIKTAYLYNFTKFIEWPQNSGQNFNLCVIGRSPIKATLSALEGKTVLDKPLRIQHFDSVKQAVDCHIAYFEQLDAADGAAINSLLLSPQLNNTLTVGSQEGFAENGGMIGFVLEHEKLKLHINLSAIKRQSLNISAKLIEVSVLVRGGENE